MFKRYMYSFAGLFCLLVVYWLTLLPILSIRTNLESRHYVLALLIWAVLAFAFVLPALATIVKKVWFFRGLGEPVVLDLLQDLLLAVNDHDSPVSVHKHGRKMVVSWRYQEPHWAERMEKNGMTRLYELWLRFDNDTKTVTMTDRYRSVNWDLSPIAVKTGWRALGSPIFKVDTGPEWGVGNYEDTIPQDYTYSEGEIKSPVLNTILNNGWNVRFSLF
ncbi:MAG: hypothetical protein ACYDBT_04455 [Desulfobulbaceae bacterium]